MSQNYHLPWTDGVTEYKATDMNTPLGELDAQITANENNIENHVHNLASSYGPYDIGGTLVGKPVAGEVILRYPFPRTVTFPQDMAASRMVSNVAANAEAVFSLKKGGVEFATATFAAASSTAVIACPTELAFATGDVLTLVSPSPQDADLEDIGWAFAAVRNAEATTTTTTTSSSSTTTTSSSSTTTTSSSSTTTTSSSSTTTTSSSSTTTTEPPP